MEKHAKVRTDNMLGTIYGHNLVTLRFSQDIDNGNILAIDKLEDGQREVYVATVPAQATKIDQLVLVASPEVVKAKSYNALNEFYNVAGDLIRGYRLTPGVFSVSKEALTPDTNNVDIVAGAVASVSGSTKIKISASADAGTKIGNVLALEGDWIVIEVK